VKSPANDAVLTMCRHEVDVQYALPLGDRNILRQTVGQHTHVVDDDVDAAKPFERRAQQLVECIGLRDVDIARQHTDVVGGQLLSSRGESVCVDVDRDDVRAAGSQAVGDGVPDAATGPGDDGDFVVKGVHFRAWG
jgi:hypothetical protein